jgi:hypothetical protein
MVSSVEPGMVDTSFFTNCSCLHPVTTVFYLLRKTSQMETFQDIFEYQFKGLSHEMDLAFDDMFG